jgi:hypothetical protein
MKNILRVMEKSRGITKNNRFNKSKSIKDNEWLVGGIIMLKDDINPKDVPIFIEKAIEKYNNDKNIVIQNNPLIDSIPSVE